MPTLSSSGTQTSSVGSEHTLYNPTGNKFYTGYVDLTNMVSGDVVEIRVSLIVKTAGSYIQYWMSTYVDAQSNPLVYIPSLPSDIGYKITLKQVAGTSRTFDWRIFEI